MQQLFQSIFLQSLGYAIANSLWQTALVWLIYISVTGLLSVNAAAKYRLAVIPQVTGFIWFLFTFRFYYHQYSDGWNHTGITPGTFQNMAASGTGFSATLIGWMVKGEQLLPYVSMAYLLLMALLCLRWINGYRNTQLIRTTGLHKMPVEWRLFTERISARLGIKKKISLFLSETINSPLTVGFLKPIILIPVASINHLTTDQLEAVLLHELAHIKRFDYLVNMILSIVELSLFFNPFTQLISKSIRKERENCCDDWVLQFQYNASVYAEALLRIASLQAIPVLAMAAAGKKNELVARVKRMIDKKESRFSYRKQLLAFVIITGMLSSVAWLNPLASHAEQTVLSTNKKIHLQKRKPYAIEPMAVRVDNPLFNPVFFLSKPLKEEMKKGMAAAQEEMENSTAESPETAFAVESFTPMVADAMKQAAFSIDDIWDAGSSKTEMAKAAKKIYVDSGFLSPKFKALFNNNPDISLKQINIDLTRAGKELDHSFKMMADAGFDKENFKTTIRNAIDQAGGEWMNAGLDKIVLDALQIPGIKHDTNNRSKTKKIPAASSPFPKEKNSKRKTEEANSEDESNMSSADENGIRINTNIDVHIEEPSEESASVMVLLPRIIQAAKFNCDVVTLQKIKTILLDKVIQAKIKMIPLVLKEKEIADNKMLIIQQ